MTHKPSVSCVQCAYPLLSDACDAKCPECGNSIQSPSLQRAGLVGRSRSQAQAACIFTSLSLLVLFLFSLGAICFDPWMYYVVPIQYQWLFIGWYCATIPAMAAIIFAYRTRQTTSIKTTTLYSFGLLGWALTCTGLYLEDEHIEQFGLVLTSAAPLALFCLFIPIVDLARRLLMLQFARWLFINAAAGAIGMTMFVGMSMAVYYDYTVGLDFYLGGRNRHLVNPVIYAGLGICIFTGFLGILAGVHLAFATLRLRRTRSKSTT